jgi:hypothetical protein
VDENETESEAHDAEKAGNDDSASSNRDYVGTIMEGQILSLVGVRGVD